jgi:hypothetical protein
MAVTRKTSFGIGAAALALATFVGMGLADPPVESPTITVYKSPT